MLFRFVTALAACQSVALRPQLDRAGVSNDIARVGQIVSKISSPGDSLVALKAATTLVDGILAETGNATDHISGDDAELLQSVVSLVEKTIYSSMDDSHKADVASLADAIHTASQCNADIARRQTSEGDLGILHQHVQDKQHELNRLQVVVSDKTDVNNTKWEEFDGHMQMISSPPACPDFPARTMPALDVFFEKSEYSIWFTAQQAAYIVVRDAFKDADSALEDAIKAYNLQKAIRDVQYCDWKTELEAACAAFDTCFSEASDFYMKTLVPRVTSDMNDRFEVKKAGDTLIHQIKFLLGEVEDQQTPPVDTSRYEIAFPNLPPKGPCDLSPLDADEWVPPVECITYYQMEQGTCCCPEADRIATEEECATAQLSFRTGSVTEIRFSGSSRNIPGGCSWRSFGGGNGRGHWNEQLVGRARDDIVPICRSVS